MAKLPAAKAKSVNENEGSSFEPMPEGKYTLSLSDVDASKEGPAGPYWSWEFSVLDEGYTNRKLWVNTSLSADAEWKLKETFEAFGAAPDTDTDELIGQPVTAIVTIRTIQKGAKAGELTNSVDTLLPFDGDVGSSEGETDENPF
jgi:hypothetical protein